MDRYFAYGSNLLGVRLRERAPSARPLGAVRLPGWAWRCNKQGADGSAKANLAREAGALAWGALFALDPADWVSLDRAEAGYRRIAVEVLAADGARLAAQTYVTQRTDDRLRPSAWYLGLVVAGAREQGLPPAWIAELERCAVGESGVEP